MSIVEDIRERLQDRNITEISRNSNVDLGHISRVRRGMAEFGASALERVVVQGFGLELRIVDPREPFPTTSAITTESPADLSDVIVEGEGSETHSGGSEKDVGFGAGPSRATVTVDN